MNFLAHHRVPYSAIVDRPPLRLPDDGRLVVWTIVNVEHWLPDRPMPRAVLPPPMGRPLLPDVPNWTWHEYGMRVGFWRLFDVLSKYDVTPTLAINGIVCETYGRVAQAARDAGWEFMGHGFIQEPMHASANQSDTIKRTIASIAAFTGKPPRGWESPGLTETSETVDILSREGIEYVADWVLDDQPVRINAHPRPVVAMPYTVETNDVVVFALQQHESTHFAGRCIAQFDQLYKEAALSARVMAISLHPYLSGVPHRIGGLERVYDHIRSHTGVRFWTGERILDWYNEQTAAPRP